MTKRNSDYYDEVIGRNIMQRRKDLGMTQSELGAALVVPISFQQVQKYERGTNRVSASTLWRFARALGCTVLDLYEGIEQPQMFSEPRKNQKQYDRASRLMAKIHDPVAREVALAQLSVMASHYNKVRSI